MPALDATAVRQWLRNALRTRFPLGDSFQDTDSLLDSGIVDSLGILEIVSLAEAEFDVRFEDADLEIEHFQSIAALAEFIVAKVACIASANGRE